MKHEIARTLTFAKLAMRPAVIMSISLAMFLFTACEMNTPSGQRDSNAVTGPQALNGSLSKTSAVVPLGSASTFAVLGFAGVTTADASLITGDLGVGPGAPSATGFDLTLNRIVGPGSVTDGIGGIVTGTIYAGGPVANQAHNDAVIAYNYLVAQVPYTIFSGVTQLSQTPEDVTPFNGGVPLTPGVYRFESANLRAGGTLYLDFQGNPDALFIFQFGTTLVTMGDSKVIAVDNNNATCSGSNVYWAVGTSATIDGAEFVGTVIAKVTVTMTSAANLSGVNNVSGRMFALGASVTMVNSTIAVCGGSGGVIPPPKPCRDFVTGGGWIDGTPDGKGHKKDDKTTFGVSGGIKNGKYWGHLSLKDHGKDGVKVKSTSVTGYIVLDLVTRQIEGTCKVNGKGSFTYTVVVADNGKRGRNDTFSLVLSNGYSASGTLKGGNIELRTKCGESDKDDKESYDDQDERDGDHNCDDD
jgi:hypothetical protein